MLNFTSVALNQLGVLVIAVQINVGKHAPMQMIINPGSRIKIRSSQMRVIVLAQSLLEAQRFVF